MLHRSDRKLIPLLLGTMFLFAFVCVSRANGASFANFTFYNFSKDTVEVTALYFKEGYTTEPDSTFGSTSSYPGTWTCEGTFVVKPRGNVRIIGGSYPPENLFLRVVRNGRAVSIAQGPSKFSWWHYGRDGYTIYQRKQGKTSSSKSENWYSIKIGKQRERRVTDPATAGFQRVTGFCKLAPYHRYVYGANGTKVATRKVEFDQEVAWNQYYVFKEKC